MTCSTANVDERNSSASVIAFGLLRCWLPFRGQVFRNQPTFDVPRPIISKQFWHVRSRIREVINEPLFTNPLPDVGQIRTGSCISDIGKRRLMTPGTTIRNGLLPSLFTLRVN